MLIAHLLEAQPGDKILDACAAPGGKTTHLAALTGNRSEITALDKYSQRVDLINRGAERLGCLGIDARCWDLAETPDFIAPETCHRILVDAPCSGLGVLRRNPESRWSRRPADIKELAALQLTILGKVAPLLKPGGILLYATCSVFKAENSQQIQQFVELHQDVDVSEINAEWGRNLNYGQQILPGEEDMDGFFYASLRKNH